MTLHTIQALFTDSSIWVRWFWNKKMKTSSSKSLTLPLSLQWRCLWAPKLVIGLFQNRKNRFLKTKRKKWSCSRISTLWALQYWSSWLVEHQSRIVTFPLIACPWPGLSFPNQHRWFRYLSNASRLTQSPSEKVDCKTSRNCWSESTKSFSRNQFTRWRVHMLARKPTCSIKEVLWPCSIKMQAKPCPGGAKHEYFRTVTSIPNATFVCTVGAQARFPMRSSSPNYQNSSSMWKGRVKLYRHSCLSRWVSESKEWPFWSSTFKRRRLV